MCLICVSKAPIVHSVTSFGKRLQMAELIINNVSCWFPNNCVGIFRRCLSGNEIVLPLRALHFAHLPQAIQINARNCTHHNTQIIHGAHCCDTNMPWAIFKITLVIGENEHHSSAIRQNSTLLLPLASTANVIRKCENTNTESWIITRSDWVCINCCTSPSILGVYIWTELFWEVNQCLDQFELWIDFRIITKNYRRIPAIEWTALQYSWQCFCKHRISLAPMQMILHMESHTTSYSYRIGYRMIAFC